MKKNVNLHFEDVREQLRDKCWHYEEGAELLADIAKVIFWTNVEVDPFGEGEGFNMLDVCGMFESVCRLDRYVDHSREYLESAKEGVITACYLVFCQEVDCQEGDFVRVYGCEPVGKYDAMHDGKCLIIEVLVSKDGKVIGVCL